jgi:hypothetical protein
MLNNKNNWLCFLLFLSVQASAQKEFTSQTTGRGDYSLVVYASGGLGYYLRMRGSYRIYNPKYPTLILCPLSGLCGIPIIY